MSLVESLSPGECSGTSGSISLGFVNVPDGAYTLNYVDQNGSDKTFSLVDVASNQATITGLTAGQYNDISIVIDGCVSQENIDVTLTDPATAVITLDVSSNPTSCDGLDGSISILGLSANNEYVVNYTANSEAITIITNSNADGSLDIRELGAGTYKDISVSSRGCQSNELSDVITLTEPEAPSVSLVSAVDPSLCGKNDGKIVLDGVKNSTRYTVSYLYNGRSVSRSMLALAGVIEITGLYAGQYSDFNVQLAGCISNTIEGPVSLSDPLSPVISLDAIQPTSSCNASDGVIVLSGLDPSEEFHYEYTYVGRIIRSRQTMTSSASGILEITGLSAGTYTYISVKRGTSNCRSNIIESAVIEDANAPVISLGAGISPMSCHGADGSIRLTGVAADKEFLVTFLSDDLLTSLTLVSTSSGVIEINNLRAGDYQDFRVSLDGCISNQLSDIVQLQDPVTPQITIANFENPMVCGEQSGSIVLSGNMADGNYSVSYDYNGVAVTQVLTAVSGTLEIASLGAGKYENFRIEGSGCTSNLIRSSISLQDPGSPQIVYNDQLNPTSCASFDGNIKLSGLTPSVSYNYTYIKDGTTVNSSTPLTADGSGIIEINNLTSGSYLNLAVFEVGSSCQSNTIGQVVLNPPNIVIWSYSNPTTCSGSDGWITINGLTPGVSYNFSYRLNGGSAVTQAIEGDSWGDFTLDSLSSGDYTEISVEIDG
ncbi:MAG: hypothetical protein RJQ14_27760, partial [Marinoscillum sp.]